MIGLATTTEPINGLTLDASKIEVGQTMAFITLALSELVHVFNIRNNQKSIFRTSIFNNSKLILAIIASAALMFVILLVEPLRNIFSIPVLPTQNILELVKKSLKDIKDAMQMVRRMVEQGCMGVIATPHFYSNETIESFLNRREESFMKLTEEIKGSDISGFEKYFKRVYIKSFGDSTENFPVWLFSGPFFNFI